MKCPYCGNAPQLVNGSAIYPHRPDLFDLKFYQCAPCDAYVGTHKNSKDHAPLGRLANAELRAAKKRAHAAFDPLWKSGGMKRGSAYAWLSDALRIRKSDAHIGMFDVAQCNAVVDAVKARAA